MNLQLADAKACIRFQIPALFDLNQSNHTNIIINCILPNPDKSVGAKRKSRLSGNDTEKINHENTK